jgi:hypothetical protein
MLPAVMRIAATALIHTQCCYIGNCRLTNITLAAVDCCVVMLQGVEGIATAIMAVLVSQCSALQSTAALCLQIENGMIC